MNQYLDAESSRAFVALCESLAVDQQAMSGVEPADASMWFLGPKAERLAQLKQLFDSAIDAHVSARQNYAIDDHYRITDEADTAPHWQQLEDHYSVLRDWLKSSVPLASYRNQSHMYWDVSLPGLVGYLAAMLYNQNNVATEASPVTTAMEMVVGRDLCEMLGFNVRQVGKPQAWGHITCDGSVANGEALWAARNLKYLAVALARAMELDPAMREARDVSVRTSRGDRAFFCELDSWDLLNLPVDEVIGLAERISSTTPVSEACVREAIDNHSLQAVGVSEFNARYLNGEHGAPKVLVAASAHYSWPKSAALLGLGTASVELVPVDLNGRLCLVALRQALMHCLRERQPVIAVVAVAGTTEFGGVDPVAGVLALRDECRQLGLEFPVHVDAAWGGYFTTMLRGAEDANADPSAMLDGHADLQMSNYVRTQLSAIAGADSITLDPHKSGFIPYPAGGLCYRNGQMRNLIAYTAPVVFHGGVDATVGPYGIEGSKPGAAAAATHLSHAVIRLNRWGHGRILGRCLFNNKRFFCGLLALAEPDDEFTISVLQRTPQEIAGATEAEINAEKQQLIAFSRMTDSALLDLLSEDSHSADLFRSVASDLSILAYSFNLKVAGSINSNLAIANALNKEIFQRASLRIQKIKSGQVPDLPIILTSSAFSTNTYGTEFVGYYAGRMGVQNPASCSVQFLISTTQNPWLTAAYDTEGQIVSPLNAVLKSLRELVLQSVDEIKRRYTLGQEA